MHREEIVHSIELLRTKVRELRLLLRTSYAFSQWGKEIYSLAQRGISSRLGGH